MKQYLYLIKQILRYGKFKENRTGIDTKVIPNVHFAHDMKNGFPLLTTKKMSLKNVAVELEGFIKGITDKQWYQERGCHIWDEWANPIAVKSLLNNEKSGQPQQQVQKEENDLGPIYGYQWRAFNKTYKNIQNEDDGDWNNYTDQLKYIVDTLKTNPNDRRMVCSAWNPNQIEFMALPPCHYAWHVVHIDGELHLHWVQRSCDAMLGIPYNIASYGLLLELLCKESGLKPGKLSATFGDCHIYMNHIQGAYQQVAREPNELPKLKIPDDNFNIFEWTHEDFELIGYNPQDRIKFEVAV